MRGRAAAMRRCAAAAPAMTAAVDTPLHAVKDLGVRAAHALQAAQERASGDREDRRGAAGRAVQASAEAHAPAPLLAQQRSHAPRGRARCKPPGLRNLP